MANTQTGYFPDGSVANDDAPCHSASIDDEQNACCFVFDICLNNNPCLAQIGPQIITRGSCTDKSWLSPECSQYCPDGNDFFQQRCDLVQESPKNG